MKKQRFKNPYKSEAELCRDVRDAAEEVGFEVYPEVKADLFLVATRRIGVCQEGDIVLVEAKLRANFEVLSQVRWPTARDRGFRRPQPNFRAVAVPYAPDPFVDIASALNLAVIAAFYYGCPDQPPYWPKKWLPAGSAAIVSAFSSFQRQDPERLLKPPELKVEVEAGVPSPKTVSKWKIDAVKLILRLRAGECLTRTEIEEAGIKLPRIREFLEPSGKKEGRKNRWRLSPTACDRWRPDKQYPEIVEALKQQEPRS